MPVEFNAKSDGVAIAGSVQRRGTRAIYHYTCIRKLPSILQYGLLSRSEMERRGICCDRPSTTWGNEAKATEFCDYICCGFTRPWGMMGQEQEALSVVCLNPRVLWRDGTIFSAKHTGYRDIHLADIIGKVTAADFDALFATSTARLPSPMWAEVLVYKVIEPGDFYRVYFCSEDDKNAAHNLCATIRVPGGRLATSVIPFTARPDFFPGFRPEE